MSDNQIMFSPGCKIKGDRCEVAFPDDCALQLTSKGVAEVCSFDEGKGGYVCGSNTLPAKRKGKIAFTTDSGATNLGLLAFFKNGARIKSQFVPLPPSAKSENDKAFFDRQAVRLYNMIVRDVLPRIVAREADDLYFKALLIADLACTMAERGDANRAAALLGKIDDILAARGLEDSCAGGENGFCPAQEWITGCRDQVLQWITILETKWGNLQNAEEFADAVTDGNARAVAYSYLEKYANAPGLEFPGYHAPRISRDNYQRQLSSIEAIRDPLVKASYLVMLVQSLPR